MDEGHAEASGGSRPQVAGCRSCGRPAKWESITDHLGELWLAVCGCGRLDLFLPDYPQFDTDDPLGVYLNGPGRHILPATPPWIRLFQRSVEEPICANWRYLPDPCVACAASVIFGTQAWPHPGVNGRYLLCLNCGQVTVNYTNIWQNRSETTSGAEWAPPCPAVQRLRGCVYRLQRPPAADTEANE